MTSDRRAIGHNRLARPSCRTCRARCQGTPPRRRAREWRYGSQGSLAINLESGTWKETLNRTRAAAFVLWCVGSCPSDRSKAVEWLIQEGFLEKGSPRMPQNQRTAYGPAVPHYSH